MQKPYITEDDDGGINLEWISHNKRFGFFISQNIIDSGWWYVDREGSMDNSERFPKEIIDYLEKYFE